MARHLAWVVTFATIASGFGGCAAVSVLDTTGAVLATGVKAGVKVGGMAVGVAADGVGAVARTVSGSGAKAH